MKLCSPHILSQKGFTLFELIIGMLIFSIGLTGILALLHSTIDNSIQSRHEIQVSNLLREQVELVKNVRNSDVRSFLPFDRMQAERTVTVDSFSGIFLVENDFTSNLLKVQNTDGSIISNPVYWKEISSTFPTTLEDRFEKTRLFLDVDGRYGHTPTATGTSYASYIRIEPLTVPGVGTIDKDGKHQGYLLEAHVIVHDRIYRDFDLRTIITDWKK